MMHYRTQRSCAQAVPSDLQVLWVRWLLWASRSGRARQLCRGLLRPIGENDPTATALALDAANNVQPSGRVRGTNRHVAARLDENHVAVRLNRKWGAKKSTVRCPLIQRELLARTVLVELIRH